MKRRKFIQQIVTGAAVAIIPLTLLSFTQTIDGEKKMKNLHLEL